MDNNQLTVINQDAKLALAKIKNLLSITNKILANRPSKELIESFKNFRFSPSLGHSRGVNSVAITPDGKYIVSGSWDKTIKLWDISSDKEIRTFKGHSSWVNSVAITPDGKYIVSGSEDKNIKLWDIKSGKLISSYATSDDGEWLSWNLNNEYNCSNGAYKYFCFVDDSNGIGEVLPQNHLIYKAKKKDKLLNEDNVISNQIK